MSRTRVPSLIIVVSVLALLAAACTQPSNTPSAYGSTTESNFLHGCTGQGSGTTLAPPNACQCAYNWFVKNVPYDTTNESTPITVFATREGATATNDTVAINQSFTVARGTTFTSINSAVPGKPASVPAEVTSALETACRASGWKAPAATVSTLSGGGPTLPKK